MQTRSSLQRRTSSESDNPLAMTIKPRPWGEAQQVQQPQAVQRQPGPYNWHDMFANDPGPRPAPNFLQAKLTVGAPNDGYEQEADRVAEQVMSMPDTKPAVQREGMPEEEEDLQTKSLGSSIQREAIPEEEEDIQTKPLSATITPLVQREVMPEEEEIQAKALGGSIQREAMPEEEEEPIQAKLIQREGMPEEEEAIQTKGSSGGGFEAGGDFESRLRRSKGGGSALPDDVRSFMEPRFGADFSGVRVHTGSESVQMNRDLNAQAFTHKQDVYFGAGKTPEKDSLTAHELTHVVQQTSNERIASQIQKQSAKPAISTPLGKGAKFAQDGSAELKAGSVTVVVLPDQVSDTLSHEESSAETKFSLEGGDAPGCEFNGKGLITKIDPIPPIKVTIQTTYRTGASPDGQSAYGKGTTKEDVKAGNTSLKYHEGSHGTDYINYLKAHSLPTFKGTKGMTQVQFEKAQQDYIKAIDKYREAMDSYSEAHTDCVGTKEKSCQ
jgi:Domain of unknown function (DUF4157)